jgi:mannose-6-phosphate isomerase-like protein (cupin superfamily)
MAASSSPSFAQGAATTAAPVPPPAGAPSRNVLASSKLNAVADGPKVFSVYRLELTNEPTEIRGDGFLYAQAGRVAYQSAGARAALAQNEARAIAASSPTLVQADAGTATALVFVLGSPTAPWITPPAKAVQIFKDTIPIPSLYAGVYEFSLTWVSFPGSMPLNPPHHRSGAAIYYVLSGTGLFAANGRVHSVGAGSIQYEPNTLTHQWGNATTAPLVFVQANISQEGVPAVVFPQ